MTRPGLFWLCYALAYVCLWAWIIAGMQREPMRAPVRPDVPAHQMSVNPWREWR
jgi:hypothetical protein